MHYLFEGAKVLLTSAAAVLVQRTRSAEGEFWGVAVIGTVIKRQPSLPLQPPRNCLTVQFLPYVHVLFSHLPLSVQLACVCLYPPLFSLFLAVKN